MNKIMELQGYPKRDYEIIDYQAFFLENTERFF
jgi:hypothetical protein